MDERGSLSISVDMDTNKLQQKLRAIAKHVGALADELNRIDNAWRCEYCGHDSYITHEQIGVGEQTHKRRRCEKCNEKCVIKSNDE